jgi:hypothetical protein
MSKRTKHDEYELDEILRAESSAKTEVLVHFREALRQEREQHAATLAMLINTTAMLQQFMAGAQDRRQRYLDTLNANPIAVCQCVPGCKEHEFDNVTGWRRCDSAKSARYRPPRQRRRGSPWPAVIVTTE